MFSLEAPSSPRLSDTQLLVKLYMKMEKKKKKKKGGKVVWMVDGGG